MNLPSFQFHKPESLDTLFALLEQYGTDARVMAGGTDLLPGLKLRKFRCTELISLRQIDALGGLSYTSETGLWIGANARLAEVAAFAPVLEHYPMLASAISTLATVQVRHKATVVGNLCNASPCADTAPPLMAYGAAVEVIGPDSNREVPLESFITGPKQTQLGTLEIVKGVRVPPPKPGLAGIFLKHSPRSRVDISAVSVAVGLCLKDDTITDVDLFLGTVGPTPLRASTAEALLRGQPINAALFEQAAAAARDQSRPITDHRATKEYKREMVYVLTRRALTNLTTRQS